MKRSLISKLSVLGFLAVGATQAQAQFSFVFDENGAASYKINDTKDWVGTKGWLGSDPTAAGGMALIYQLPKIVGPGDVYFTEPSAVGTVGDISDVLRFYTLTDATGLDVSYMNFYSGKGDTDLADTGFPNLDPAAYFGGYETGREGGNQWIVWQPGGNSYYGLSDRAVPAPAALLTVGFNALFMYRRRAKKA